MENEIKLLCPVCHGIPVSFDDIEFKSDNLITLKVCLFCLGKRFLDWTEIITGADESFLEEVIWSIVERKKSDFVKFKKEEERINGPI